MKKIVAVFAHPDDEAFGPGGTLAILAQNAEVSVICVTNGEAGQCESGAKMELGEIRKQELKESAEILGVKNVYFLDYKDGCLCNSLYHEIATKIETLVRDTSPETLLTFEMRGISGHIDHITVSMITTFVFERIETVKEIWYYCLSKAARRKQKDYFIFFPPGYDREQVDNVIDIKGVWEQKVQAMRIHKSQMQDVNRVLGVLTDLPKEEYFFVRKRAA